MEHLERSSFSANVSEVVNQVFDKENRNSYQELCRIISEMSTTGAVIYKGKHYVGTTPTRGMPIKYKTITEDHPAFEAILARRELAKATERKFRLACGALMDKCFHPGVNHWLCFTSNLPKEIANYLHLDQDESLKMQHPKDIQDAFEAAIPYTILWMVS